MEFLLNSNKIYEIWYFSSQLAHLILAAITSDYDSLGLILN